MYKSQSNKTIKSIKVAFFGSSENSAAVLQSLKKSGFSVEVLVCPSPKPAGRDRKIRKTPPHILAEKSQIQVLSPDKLDLSFHAQFSQYSLDVCAVADYARLIPKNILKIPERGFLNLHPSLLPKYRGPSPAEFAILNGDKITGMTIIKMDEKFDHGPIISQFKEEITDQDTAQTLYQRLFLAGSKVLTTIIPAWLENQIIPRKQDHSQATYAPRLSRKDGFIPWKLIQIAISGKEINPGERPKIMQKARGTWPEAVERAIRAFHPWPGIWTIVSQKKGKKRLKILSANIVNSKLIPDRVQLSGKTPGSWKDTEKTLTF